MREKIDLTRLTGIVTGVTMHLPDFTNDQLETIASLCSAELLDRDIEHRDTLHFEDDDCCGEEEV